MTQPVLIVVCGAPASGKTTLARRLTADLRVPLLEKDTIKESLANVFEPSNREESKRVGAASFELLYDLAFRMLASGMSVMLEGNLTVGFAARNLERLARVAALAIVQCESDPAMIEHRYRERAATGGRHAAHFDMQALPDLKIGLESGGFDLTDLGYPATVVRTNDGYQPAYNDILASLRQHSAEMPQPPIQVGRALFAACTGTSQSCG